MNDRAILLLERLAFWQGWFSWLAIIFLLFSSMGNWRYTHAAQRKYGLPQSKDALDILNVRYARRGITRDQHHLMKSEIARIS